MANYMPLILDGICVAVLLGTTVSYFRKGFVKVFVEFVGFLAASVCGVISGRILAALVYDRFIEGVLLETLMEYQPHSEVTQTLAEELMEALQGLPEWISGILSLFSIDAGQAVELIGGLSQPDTAAMAHSLTENLLQPVFLSFLGLLFFLFAFVILWFVFRRLARLMGGIANHIPVVNGLNQLFGGAVGVVSGGLWLFFIAALVSLFLLVTGGTEWLTRSMVEESRLFSQVFERVPF